MSRTIETVSHYCLIISSILAMSYVLPAGFDKVFVSKATNPLLLFSPLEKQFVYRESLGGHRFNYANEEGRGYKRTGFEAQLPFLYYKNLEKKKQLPVSINGESFDKTRIKAGKQGLEIKSRHLNGHRPQIRLYPLFNNDPDVAFMPFPEDVVRFTDKAMEFINADSNQIDKDLTAAFSAELLKRDFVFPATVIGCKPTNLKPFDEGFFVRDSKGQVFHLRRVLNKPVIVKTPIDSSLDILDIIITENRRKEFYGTLVTQQGRLFLISYENYRLIPLPVKKYHPDNMDCKLLINPLYKTAITAGPAEVNGTAMNGDYQAIRSFELERQNPQSIAVRIMRDLLFPFELLIDNQFRGQADLRVRFGSLWALAGILSALVLYIISSRSTKQAPMNMYNCILILVTGFFGLTTLFFLERD
jgi:Domain of unknown function (DUF4857)